MSPRAALHRIFVALLCAAGLCVASTGAAPAAPAAASSSAKRSAAAAAKPRACTSRRARRLRTRSRRTCRRVAPAARGPRAFEVGLVNSAWKDERILDSLRAPVARVEFPIGTSARGLRDTVEALAAAGTRLLPLAGFSGRLPSAAEARNLRDWATEYGPNGSFWADRSDGALAVRDIEFGNETNAGYQYGDNAPQPTYALRARNYAHRAMVAIDALQGTGVGLLAQGTDGGTQYSTWIDNVVAAEPALAGRISAWTVHTYAPDWKTEMDRTVRQLAAAGTDPSIPFAVTETGYATDGGRCLDDNYGHDRCMSYDEAASALAEKVTGMRARYGSRLESMMLYMERDLERRGESREREDYFGLTRADGSDKGAYTQIARDLFAGRGPAR